MGPKSSIRTKSVEDLPQDLRGFPEAVTLAPIIDTPYSNRNSINQRLLAVKPDDFAGEEDLKTNAEHNTLNLNEQEKQQLRHVSEILHSPKLDQLIEEGKITVALIKPHVHKGKMTATDDKIAKLILKGEIKDPLQVVFALPTHMTPQDVRYFYDSIYDMLSTKPDPETNGKTMVWDRHQDYMTSGAVTMVLLYCEKGNAVDEWRRQLGPTVPEKDLTGETIRGKYGWDIRGNVGHGSNADTPEEKAAAVKYEAGWMRGRVDKMLAAKENGDKFMGEEELRAHGILEDGEVFLAIEKFLPKQRVSLIGSSFTAYIVSFIDKNGKHGHKRFAVKSFDNAETKEGNINEALAEKEKSRIEAFAELLARSTPKKYQKSLNTGTPKLYDISKDNEDSPALLRDYVPSHNQTALNIVNNYNFEPSRRCDMIEGLIYAAALMDMEGIKSKNIAENFLYNGSSWIYIGGSSIEVESPIGHEISTGLADLLQSFGNDPELADKIRKRYNLLKKSLTTKKAQTES